MKKFLCFMTVFALCFSFFAFSVSAGDSSIPDATPTDLFETGTQASDIPGFDSFRYIKGWKNHYTYDFDCVDTVFNERTLVRIVLYTDSDDTFPKPTIEESEIATTFRMKNTTGNGFIKIYSYYYEYDSWNINNSHSGNSEFSYHFYSPNFSVLSSPTDIMKYGTDEVFFSKMPPITGTKVEVAWKTALHQTMAKMTPTVKILLLCGVGCLALLIGLKVFFKVFRRFRVR